MLRFTDLGIRGGEVDGGLLALPLVRFFIVGGTVGLLGVGLLALLVERLKVPKSWANGSMLVVTLQLSFLLNNFWSFGHVPADGLGDFTERWLKYQGLRLVPLFLEQVGFVWLTNQKHWPYLLASVAVIATGFVAVFLGSEALIFVKK